MILTLEEKVRGQPLLSSFLSDEIVTLSFPIVTGQSFYIAIIETEEKEEIRWLF